MKETNKNIFEEEISPRLEKVAKHIRPGRWEDIEDIKQELKACALNFIDWAEKKGETITHPKAVVQRAARYIISGRRAFSQKVKDPLHTHRRDDKIIPFNPKEHAINNQTPVDIFTEKNDMKIIETLLGKEDTDLMNMVLSGEKHDDIRKEFNITSKELLQRRKSIVQKLKDWADPDNMQKEIAIAKNTTATNKQQGESIRI